MTRTRGARREQLADRRDGADADAAPVPVGVRAALGAVRAGRVRAGVDDHDAGARPARPGRPPRPVHGPRARQRGALVRGRTDVRALPGALGVTEVLVAVLLVVA